MASLRGGSTPNPGFVCPIAVKVSYKNKRSARIALDRRRAQGYDQLTVAPCPACHGWHIVAQP